MTTTATHAHVPRERILRALPPAPAVLLVCAPAGWGKSSFLRDWCGRVAGPSVRVDLLRRHADTDAFLDALARACERSGTLAGKDWVARIEPDGRPASARLHALLDRLPAGASVVLDDVHELPEGAPSSGLLEGLVAAARSGALHLVIAARTAPSCIRARDVVHGTALHIGARELAMDAEEILLFFRGTPAGADAEFLARAAERTEGWPAGLRTLRHRVAGADPSLALRHAGEASEDLAVYFDEEIVAPLSESVRAALADAALLDRIDREVCELLGHADVFEHLRMLARDGLFVAEAGDGLRLHPMLRDHLAHRLRTSDPGRAADRFDRIADWHERHDRTLESIDAAAEACALAPDAHDVVARAARRLEAAAPSLIEAGRRDRFIAAGEHLPQESVAARPCLLRLLQWARGALDEPRPRVAHDAPGADGALCMDHVIDAMRALRDGQVEDCAAASMAARRFIPEGDAFLRNQVVAVLQAAFRFGGDPRVGEAALEEAERVAEDVRRPAAAVQAGAMLGILRIMHGRLFAADEVLRHALAIADARLDPGAPARGLAHQFLGYVLHEWDRLDESALELERARAIAEPIGHHGILTGTLRVLATVHHQRGDPAAARETLGALVTCMDRPETGNRNREWLDGVRAAYAVTARETDGLRAWLARRGYVPTDIAALPATALHARLQEYTTLGQALLMLQWFDDAAAVNGALATAADDAGRSGFFVVCASALAAAYEGLGHRDEADVTLARALRRAAPEHMVRAVADTPGPIAAVLARARPNGVPLAFLEAVRRGAGTHAPTAGLTDRERDVLVLLAGGQSNKALARTLGVSISTVKTHLHHAFRKLGARSRTHALARARDMGLLGRAADPAGWRTEDEPPPAL